MLKDLTLVIFTLGRPEYLRDLLYYWSHFDSEVKILILDGSVSPLDIDELEFKKEFKTKIKFFALNNFWDRFEYASKNIETKYAVWHADDDFLLPSGLELAMKQISETRETCIFSNVRGFELNYLQDEHSIESWRKKYELNSNSPLERAYKFAGNRANRYFYAIWPTELFSKALKVNAIASRTLQTEKLIFGDIGFELAGCLLAKLQIANSNFYLKRVGLESQPTTTDMPTLNKFINSPESNNDFKKWIHTFAIEINNDLQLDFDFLLAELENIFFILTSKEIEQDIKFKSSYSYKLSKFYLSNKENLLFKYFLLLPKFFYRSILEPRRGVSKKLWPNALRKENSEELTLIYNYMKGQINYSKKVK